MQPDEYRVCVAGGYPIRARGAGYEAEAIVYVWGGRTVARFIAGGSLSEGAARRAVGWRAQSWIAADAETRVKMQASEHVPSHIRAYRWREWWANDAA